MTFLNLVWLVIAGSVLGVVAKLFLRGRQDIGFLWTIGAGIVGMLAGNGLASLFGVRDTAGIDWVRHFLQIGCAVVAIIAVIALKNAMKGRTTTTT